MTNSIFISLAANGTTSVQTTTRFACKVIMMSDHDDMQEQQDTDVLVAPPQVKRPPLYAVVLLNDDYTPMDFVVEILQSFFGLDIDRATQIMMAVHHTGKGIAGVYPYSIAETKANQVNNYARSHDHPLLCQIEPQAE